MNNEGSIDSAAAVFQRPDYTTRNSFKGHDAALAAGGLPVRRELNEDTPLLWRTDSVASQPPVYQAAAAGGAGGDGNGGDAGPEASDAAEWPGTTAFAHLPWYRRPSMMWVLPSLMVHTLAFGALLVPRLTLILELVCRDYFADRAMHDPKFVYIPVVFDGSSANGQCDVAVIQKLVADFTLAIQFITGTLSLLVAPRLGSLSDRYGRTRIVAMTGLGVFFNEFITICAAKFPDTVSVNWLLLGAFFDGLSGTFITALAVTNAYASDCTPPSGRVVAFGRIHGALFAGIAIGPFLTSIVLGLTGDVLTVFYIAIVAHAFLVPYNLFIVPESVTKERQMEAREKAKIAWESSRLAATPPVLPNSRVMRTIWSVVTFPKEVVAPLSVLWPTGPGSSSILRRNLVVLASIDTILLGVSMGAGAVLVYYSRYMFHWEPIKTSNFVATASTCRVFTLLVIVPVVARLVRGKPDPKRPVPNTGSDKLDLWFIRVGILLDVVGYIGYSLADQGTLFFLSGCVASFGGMASPTLQSSMTKHAPPEDTGRLLGANAMLQGSARVVAPLVLNLIYRSTVENAPHAVFMVLTVVFSLTLVLSFLLRPHVRMHVDNQEPTESTEQEAEREPLL